MSGYSARAGVRGASMPRVAGERSVPRRAAGCLTLGVSSEQWVGMSTKPNKPGLADWLRLLSVSQMQTQVSRKLFRRKDTPATR